MLFSAFQNKGTEYWTLQLYVIASNLINIHLDVCTLQRSTAFSKQFAVVFSSRLYRNPIYLENSVAFIDDMKATDCNLYSIIKWFRQRRWPPNWSHTSVQLIQKSPTAIVLFYTSRMPNILQGQMRKKKISICTRIMARSGMFSCLLYLEYKTRPAFSLPNNRLVRNWKCLTKWIPYN